MPLETIKNINTNYANVLGFGTSLLTAMVTIIYVTFTYRQTKASEKTVILAEQSSSFSQQAATANQQMVESMHKQLKQANHPCIIPRITATHGSKCFYKDRRQLLINFEISNIGNGPALGIYAFAWFKLKYIKYHDNDLVPMFYLPDYVPSLAIGEKAECSLRFENEEIDVLVEDLNQEYKLNMERVNTNPSRPVFHGTDLVIKIYYKNISNQWYEATYMQEIKGLFIKNEEKADKSPKDIENSKGRTSPKREKQINKHVPPKKLLAKDEFTLGLASEMYSILDIKMVSRSQLYELLEIYNYELNDPVSVIGNE